jgi:hypothetical protein
VQAHVSSPLLVFLACVIAACGDPGDRADGRICLAESEGVTEAFELAASNECPLGNTPCMDDYLAFPDRAAQWANPLSTDEYDDLLHQMRSSTMPLVDEELDDEELRTAILEGAGIAGLTAELSGRELRVSHGEYETVNGTTGDAVLRIFQFEDPFVGRVWGLLAHPDGPGPFPTVVGIHGHTEDAWEWMLSRGGVDLVDGGYAVIFPTMRVNQGDQDEALITETLLRAGFSFVGLRMYETLLTLRYAASLPEVDRCRIGMMGHSGGAISGNASVRVAEGLSAWVSDLTSSYYVEGPEGGVTDETSPGLYALHPLINDFTSAAMPVLEVGYNFEVHDEDPPIDQWPEVRAFLDEQLLDH